MIAGYVSAAGVVLMSWLCVVSGMIAGCVRRAQEPSVDPRDALIREQAARLEAQAEQIAGLEALVAELREQLEAALRASSRNSSNSSVPP